MIAARSEDKLTETQHLCQEHTSHVHTVVADVSREEDCEAIVEKAVEEFGGVDILILNAAYSVAGQWFTEYKKPVRNPLPTSPSFVLHVSSLTSRLNLRGKDLVTFSCSLRLHGHCMQS